MIWEPFLLNPDMADEGEPILDHLTKKYGPSARGRFEDPDSHLMRAGRAVGIEFTNDRNAYPTIRAHALMERVKEDDNDKANALMEEMYKSYFVSGGNINDEGTLAELAAKVGVDRDAAVEAMSSAELRRRVVQKDREYKTKARVSGVPYYIIEKKGGGGGGKGRPAAAFSGAQPPDLIAEFLEEAAAEPTGAANEGGS